MFQKFLEERLSSTDRLYYNFCGINRKEFPKWLGWKLISQYKEKGIDIKNIKDEKLDILVENFYYLEYIKQKDQTNPPSSIT